MCERTWPARSGVRSRPHARALLARRCVTTQPRANARARHRHDTDRGAATHTDRPQVDTQTDLQVVEVGDVARVDGAPAGTVRARGLGRVHPIRPRAVCIIVARSRERARARDRTHSTQFCARVVFVGRPGHDRGGHRGGRARRKRTRRAATRRRPVSRAARVRNAAARDVEAREKRNEGGEKEEEEERGKRRRTTCSCARPTSGAGPNRAGAPGGRPCPRRPSASPRRGRGRAASSSRARRRARGTKEASRNKEASRSNERSVAVAAEGGGGC